MENRNRDKSDSGSAWRLLDTPPMTAAENMALDDTLLALKGRGKTPNTLRFLQFSPRAVLVGYHQSLQEEIRMAHCLENGIDMNRRITGGGAILFDENQLGWEVICDKSFFNIDIPNNRLFETLCRPVVDALDILGVAAKFRPRNDIEIHGRKISGTGGTESGAAFLFQGTLLVDFDVDTMLKALRIPVEKLKAKEIDSVKERVTCLNWELGYTPALEAIKDAIKSGFQAALNIDFVPGGLTPGEQRLFEKKRAVFRSTGWIDRVNLKFRKKESVQSAYKTEAGLIRFSLAVDLPQKRLKDVFITGDFLSFPTRALYDMEAALRGAPLNRDVLHGIIGDFFRNGKIRIPGMRFEEFIQPLNQSLEKIKIAAFGIPLAYCNAISVVNDTFSGIAQKKPSVLLLPYCAKLADCDMRYQKGCRVCGETACSIGPAWAMGQTRNLRVVSIVSYEDLWGELTRMRSAGVAAFIGCCCQPFFVKHVDDFKRAGLPGILLDIDNTTCYDLDQAKRAYAGTFEAQTEVNINLLHTVLAAVT